MEVFGDLERLIDDLYPYRWPLLAIALLVCAGVCWLAARRGWFAAMARHRWRTTLVGLPILAVALTLGYWTLSPLWTRTELDEESPLASARVITPVVTPPATASAPPAPSATVTREPVTASTPTAPPATGSVDPTPMAASPTSTPPPPAATPTTAPFEPRVTQLGSLSGADDFHFAEGDVLLIETAPGTFTLRLEEVSVRNGPDLYVYLSPSADGISDGAINLGGLKATDGSFNYEVPPGTDVSLFSGVVIWCNAFAVLFATAPLAPAG